MRIRVVDQSNIPPVSQTTSIKARSANSGSVVAEIHVNNEDTIVVTNMESLPEEDSDGEHGQQGCSLNQ